MFQIISAFTSKYAHRIEESVGMKNSLIAIVFLVSISFILMAKFVFLFAFIFAFIQQFVRGYRSVIISDYINKEIKGELRATILSVESLMGRLVATILLPILG
jgi:hypothetical protein